MASCLSSKPEISERVADLLIWASGAGPSRAQAIRLLFSDCCTCDNAEVLGMARTVLLLFGIAPEHKTPLSGEPRTDLANLMEGEYPLPDLSSPATYAAPSLLDAYHHMGAGFTRGVDRVFHVVTGHTLAEHLRRALALLDSDSYSEVSCEG